MRLSKKDKEIIEMFKSLDLSKKVARVILCFSQKTSYLIEDLMKASGQVYSMVYSTLQFMVKKRWIETETIREVRQGRPVMKYTLTKSFDMIIQGIIEIGERKIKDLRKNIEVLKTYKNKFRDEPNQSN